MGLKTIISAAIGFAFAFLITGMGMLEASHSLVFIFGSGMIAICAMILPGISGAFMLLLMGQYEYLISALHSLDITVIAVFLAGGLAGLFSTVRVLGHLLKEHKPVTMAFLLGLMIGALRLPSEKIAVSGYVLHEIMLAGVTGFLIVIILERLAQYEGRGKGDFNIVE